ncbi:hypothetical protein DUI87_13110 [Hirundo rustica rustica]|uniref:Rna-directed dna polymerase from mobile element jockey-like n=1 Tax=Hirundo rustica rustica TaxID=333673 RepID=A0A3M0KB02_HIRRU|nr:hypothetical protein DUI87_13110 [Hirundo rustica rustica]
MSFAILKIASSGVSWPVISSLILTYGTEKSSDFSMAWNRTNCTFNEFADDTKLREVSDMPEGRTATQRGLNRLEKWAGAKHMKVRKKAKSPGPEEEQPQAPVCAGTTQLESSLAEKDLRGFVNTKININQQHAPTAKKANGILGCI